MKLLLYLGFALLTFTEVQAQQLTFQGFGSIKFGQRIESVRGALEVNNAPTSKDDGCYYAVVKRYPNVRIMVENHRVSRIEVPGTVPNVLGIVVGSTNVQVKKMYPNLVERPHHYDDEGHYLIIKSKSGASGFVLESHKGKVALIRAGRFPSVEYVEGCL